MSATKSTGAMAYMALEKFDGKLRGKDGSFYFSHTATMIKGDAGSSVLNIVVVAGSGTGEFVGLSGKLRINIDAHRVYSYQFDYELP